MKQSILIMLSLCLVASVSAQRVVNVQEKVSGNQTIYLDLKFADDIVVEQWNKAEISVEVTVDIDEGKGNEFYELKTNRSGSRLELKSDYGDYFKNKWSDKNRNNCNSVTDIDYKVYVPKDVSLHVKSISGSFEADAYVGALETELISGNITIKKYDGALKLETISGDVDVVIAKAKVDASTVTGTIYSNLEINQNTSKRSGSNVVKGAINGGTQYLRLKTVSGNIYMRKS